MPKPKYGRVSISCAIAFMREEANDDDSAPRHHNACDRYKDERTYECVCHCHNEKQPVIASKDIPW